MDLHARALHLSREYKRVEHELILVLQQIDRAKLYKKRGHSSLFLYAVKELQLSEAFAYSIISVSRKAASLPVLQANLRSQKISVHKASRLVSALDEKNAAKLIEFATTHSSREIDREVARLNPEAARPDRTKFISDELVKLEVTISRETYEKLKRVKDLIVSKGQKSSENMSHVLDLMIEGYLDRHDPVRKAGRSFGRQLKRRSGNVAQVRESAKVVTLDEAREAQEKFCARRKPLLAWQKHAVMKRDGGRCTFIDSQGIRCQHARWVQFHHVQHVASGGSNEPENLRTLCWYHHDLVHQLSFPIEDRAIQSS